MPRRKIPISLIGNRRTRNVTFAKRKEVLKKKAQELATLCDVPVAVVYAGPDGGAPDFWPSEAAAAEVVARYRALPAAERARYTHDHAGYVAAELGKENAKLARLREGGAAHALAPWDRALDDLPPEALRELLGSIDASLSAARARMQMLLQPPGNDNANTNEYLLQLVPVGNTAPAGYAATEDVLNMDEYMTERHAFDFWLYDCGQWPMPTMEQPLYDYARVSPAGDVELQMWPWML